MKCLLLFQANAALMFDSMAVLTEAFSKMLRKKPDLFRGTNSGNNGGVGMGSNSNYGGSTFGFGGMNGSREIHCGTGPDFMDPIVPFELGEKIAKYIRKVRRYSCCKLYTFKLRASKKCFTLKESNADSKGK